MKKLLGSTVTPILLVVILAFFTAPVTVVFASDISFEAVAVNDDLDNGADDGNKMKSVTVDLLLLLMLMLFFKLAEFLLGLLLVSFLVGTGVGVVLVDVVVVVISLNVEPAMETIGVSSIMAAAKDETATATTAAALDDETDRDTKIYFSIHDLVATMSTFPPQNSIVG
ncbi:hypothetical protein GQX74_008010 [Glossina fuscipes]|nr:hypothetical protein GQX74_008010 [Glossina fuscipes]